MPVIQCDVQMFLVEMLCEAGFCDNFGAPAVARESLRGGAGWMAGCGVWRGVEGGMSLMGGGTERQVVHEVKGGWDIGRD